MNKDYQIFPLENFIEQASKAFGKPVVFLRSYGWNHSTNIDKINESMDVYKELLPLDMFLALKQSEFVFLVIEDISDAMEFFDDTFPKSQAECEPEFYIFYSVVNELGQTVLSNE